MQIVRKADFAAVPWKNGGGVTHEAWREPRAGASFRCRVSVARIESSGAFSDFTGYRRTLVLLAGNGVILRFATGETHRLARAGELVRFDGATPVTAELIGGPCTDLNLMIAEALDPQDARVLRLDASLALASGRRTLVMPIDASVRLACAAETVQLGVQDLAIVEKHERPMLDGTSQVFVATLP